ncbi:hypothetical protein HWV62_27636 [Athelia sp. TMB]|nr:hypothetical protein HWV62_27636 [Athelia sp. TMB]
MRSDPPPSSPRLKAYKQGIRHHGNLGGDSWRLPACFLALGLIAYFRWLGTTRGDLFSAFPDSSAPNGVTGKQETMLDQGTHSGIMARSRHPIAIRTMDLPDPLSFGSIPAQSLTIILPVDSASLPDLERIILRLLETPNAIREIVVSCPDVIFSGARQIVRKIVSTDTTRHRMEMSLHPHPDDRDSAAIVLSLASEATTGWVLLLGGEGLEDFSNQAPNRLTNPTMYPLPIGPRGFLTLSSHSTNSCIQASSKTQAASFLVPPFVSPTKLLREHVTASKPESWSDLGMQISKQRLDSIGGVVMGSESAIWCSPSAPDKQGILLDESTVSTGLLHVVNSSNAIKGYEYSPDTLLIGMFAIILPSLEDVQALSSMLCRLQTDGHHIHILLHVDTTSQDTSSNSFASGRGCRLRYDTLVSDGSTHPDELLMLDWFKTLHANPDVVIGLRESFLAEFSLNRRTSQFPVILLPHVDLPYCNWMGSLSVEEWKSWNTPKIEISIITNDRPHSLERLLASLSAAKFFGDTLQLRVNLEQSSDTITKELVQRFRWGHGTTVINHRVIHGGLLPAVVESWYPQTDDSYGLLLEDDVELSPMFYAWVKMSILRYRYGKASNRSPQLFGISLYQQKIVELRLEGRRPFDAKSLFFDQGLPHPHTPYLSQIPCSWGAVYFPEHWKEFHEYLAVRLSEYSFTINEEVVPDVRSNRWTKSWKKFFIELVYLRGYIMLYPNYADFISLSTNHLEVGSHVKDLPADVYSHRKEMFLLPLMPLPLVNETEPMVYPRILDMPGQTLPAWETLPVLNLTGTVTSSKILIDQGQARRSAITNCSYTTSMPHDIQDLLCIYHRHS